MNNFALNWSVVHIKCAVRCFQRNEFEYDDPDFDEHRFHLTNRAAQVERN